eukprot:15446333-Alexandrium_andersonii.AAC.1
MPAAESWAGTYAVSDLRRARRRGPAPAPAGVPLACGTGGVAPGSRPLRPCRSGQGRCGLGP